MVRSSIRLKFRSQKVTYLSIYSNKKLKQCLPTSLSSIIRMFGKINLNHKDTDLHVNKRIDLSKVIYTRHHYQNVHLKIHNVLQ